MKLRFLVKSEPTDDLMAIDSVQGESAKSLFGKDDSDIWVAEFSTFKDRREDAVILSAISERFQSIECLTLEDDASSYFERKLYKSLARFERGLRAVLYLSVISKGGDFKDELIADLERIDFGELFQRLFIDEGFNKQCKSLVNPKGAGFEKADLIERIEALKERPKWDELFGEAELCTIRKSHTDIRGFRNDVMHAHSMTSESFERAKGLLDKANEELRDYSDQLLHGKESSDSFIDSLLEVFTRRVPKEGSFREALRNVTEGNSSLYVGGWDYEGVLDRALLALMSGPGDGEGQDVDYWNRYKSRLLGDDETDRDEEPGVDK